MPNGAKIDLLQLRQGMDTKTLSIEPLVGFLQYCVRLCRAKDVPIGLLTFLVYITVLTSLLLWQFLFNVDNR